MTINFNKAEKSTIPVAVITTTTTTSNVKESMNNYITKNNINTMENNNDYDYNNYNDDDDDNNKNYVNLFNVLMLICLVFIIFVTAYYYSWIRYIYLITFSLILFFPMITDYIFENIFVISARGYYYISGLGKQLTKAIIGS